MKRLTTGEIAKRIGVSPITIRNWHKSGKLIPEYIDPETKHRYYTEEQVYQYHKDLKKAAYKDDMLELAAYTRDIESASAREQNETIMKYLHNRGITTNPIQEKHKTYPNSELRRIVEMLLNDEIQNIVVTTEDVFLEGTKDIIKHLLDYKNGKIIIAE